MKKVLSAVMCLLLLTGLFAIPVSAVETYQLVLDYVVSADRTVTVKTKIENGSAAPYTRVELRVDGQTLQELDSGGSYTCVFDEPVPAQVSEVLLVTETYSSTGYTFKGTIVDITHEFGVVTVDTEVSEIEGAGEIVAAASGATLDDATAKLSVDVEKALATVSGSSVQEWMAYASLTMDRRIYDARFADVMGQVHFELTYASALDRVESYVAAKNSHADFMQYNDDEVWGVALDLNFVSVYGDERVWIDMQDDTTSRYTVTLPIPKKLVDCHAYAVAYFDEEGNATLEPVAIQNNVLTVTVNGVAPMAIVGMGTNADVVVSQEGATVNGTRVELPVDVDRALESDFGTTAEVLMDKVVFWMHKSDYDRLVDPAVAALHLEIRSASHYVTDDMLIAAKNNDVRYNVYTDEQVKGIALDVRLMYLSDQMHAAISSGKGGTASIEFDMQIPVPAALSSCEVITVAMVNEKGITMLIPVVQEGGMITLPSTISLGKIVLIGLGTANAT
ncbi:MAG: hypothetical protein IKV35_01170, partial [Clostridia bacterium]|nr:hypothetical protein [Clostridia bacterium]